VSYLVFIVSVGLLALLGAGGPLHRDTWLEALDRRIDAIEVGVWVSLFMRIFAPLFMVGIALTVTQLFLGDLAQALIGVLLLYFSWGRGDYPTELQRFLARARVGDSVGAGAFLDLANSEPTATAAWETEALAHFTYRGYARWFPPVLYFCLLGPFAAAAYRLVVLANARSGGRFDDAQNLLEWLPSRLLLLTFAVLGDFDSTRRLVTANEVDGEVSVKALLAEGVERAWHLDESDLQGVDKTIAAVETAAKAINRSCAVWVILISLAALL
jgi:AmpE protein